MADGSQYAMFGRNANNAWRESTNISTLENAVQCLKRDVETAYHFSMEDDARAAHTDLVAAEWRLRTAKRRAQR